MRKASTVLKFKGKRLKTPKDVRALESAILEDLRSGAVTAREAREIHVQIAAMLKRFVDGKIEAKEKPSRSKACEAASRRRLDAGPIPVV
jgi:hypothetical protein